MYFSLISMDVYTPIIRRELSQTDRPPSKEFDELGSDDLVPVGLFPVLREAPFCGKRGMDIDECVYEDVL